MTQESSASKLMTGRLDISSTFRETLASNAGRKEVVNKSVSPLSPHCYRQCNSEMLSPVESCSTSGRPQASVKRPHLASPGSRARSSPAVRSTFPCRMRSALVQNPRRDCRVFVFPSPSFPKRVVPTTNTFHPYRLLK